MLTPKQMMSPFLTSLQVETWVTQNILGLNLSYSSSRPKASGTAPGKGMATPKTPTISNLVLTLVNKHRHLARVTALSTGVENVIRVKTMYHGSTQELDRHIRTLVLVFRQSEWSEWIPVDPDDLPLHQEHDIFVPEAAEGAPAD